MAHREIDLVTVIADACFRAGGETVPAGAPLDCTRSTAKQLIANGQAHYATPEELQPEPKQEPESEQQKGSGKSSGKK